MLKKYMQLDGKPLVTEFMLNIHKMKAELNEHRYYLERKVEYKTAHLLTRINMLEACNKTLGSKLSQAHKKLAELQPAISHPDAESTDSGSRLYVVNSHPENSSAAALHSLRVTHAVA